MKKADWIWHYVSNNAVCQECGDTEHGLPEYICDAHTHGMNKHGHLEFHVVVDYGPQEIGRLLNEMGFKVQNVERFKDGDEIEGLYLDCNIYLCQVTDAHERPILRLVIPDKHNRLHIEWIAREISRIYQRFGYYSSPVDSYINLNGI